MIIFIHFYEIVHKTMKNKQNNGGTSIQLTGLPVHKSVWNGS